MDLIIILCIILGIMLVLGYAFQADLNEIEEKDPKYRKYLKNKYKI
jgi:hypothetical protein